MPAATTEDTSAWTPVDESASAASAWTPVEEKPKEPKKKDEKPKGFLETMREESKAHPTIAAITSLLPGLGQLTPPETQLETQKGIVKRLGSTAYDVLRTAGPVGMAAGYLADKAGLGQKVEKLTEEKTPEQEVGGYAADIAMSALPVGKAGAAARAARTATESSGSIEAIAKSIPKMGPVARWFAEHIHLKIPGVPFKGPSVADVIDKFATKYGPDLNGVPKQTKQELANQFFKENYGKTPETAKEKLQALSDANKFVREKSQSVKAAKASAEKPPSITQPPLAHQLYEETHGIAPKTAEQKVQALKELRQALKEKEEAEAEADEIIKKATKEPLKPKGTKAKEPEGKTEAGVSPMGKLKIRADIFSNVDQIARKAGANITEFKKSFREIVEKKYGKGLSEMNEEELMQVANNVQELLKK